jgi:hypothetical protein
MKRLLTVGLLFTQGILTAADLAQATEEKVSRADQLAMLEDKRINESSGLAISRHSPDLLWTLNDSGGPATLYGINRQGKTVTEIEVTNAKNIDWEDLASGSNAVGQPTLFIADIGDNLSARSIVQVYEVPEPVSTASTQVHKLKATRVWKLRYPDGPANAETLLVHPKTGRLHLLTKTMTGEAVLHRLPAKHEPGTVQVMEKITQLHFPAAEKVGKAAPYNMMTTGGCLSCDATRLVVSTYNTFYEWALPNGELTAEALAKMPIRLNPPLTRQMEAVCYEADTHHLLFTSEVLPAPLYRLQR